MPGVAATRPPSEGELQGFLEHRLGREDLWKAIKVKRSGVDLYVPSDEEVTATLKLACGNSGDERIC